MVDSTTEISARGGKGYRRRCRPVTSSLSSKKNTSTPLSAARLLGQPTADNFHEQHAHCTQSSERTPPCQPFLSISFLVPPSVPSVWLLQTTPLVLVRHLLYARGLIPMSVEQLFSDGSGTADPSRRSAEAPAGRSAAASRPPPASLRRKIERTRSQIRQLCQEWTALESWGTTAQRHGRHPSDVPNQPAPPPLEGRPAFVLISLGPSYTRSRELYLLDLQTWKWHSSSSSSTSLPPSSDDNVDCHASLSSGNDGESRRMERTLARRLITSLMTDEDCPTHELPARSSPSFRLWLTLGFDSRPSPFDADVALFGNNTRPSDDPLEADGAAVAPTALIPRPRLPVAGLTKRGPGSKKRRGVVSIRLRRRGRPHPPDVEEEEGKEPSHLDPTSPRLVWMSLPTCVKGFRL